MQRTDYSMRHKGSIQQMLAIIVPKGEKKVNQNYKED